MNGFKAFFTSLLFAFLMPSLLQGQDPVSIRYTVEDGLPSNEVYDVYEDKTGNLWFATDHGIARYDGYSFTNYSTDDGLSDNTVFEFREDHKGVVWMRCFNGTLSCMQDGRIYPYPHNDLLKTQLSKSFMSDFSLDDKGHMFFTVFREHPVRTKVLDLSAGMLQDLPVPGMDVGGLLNYDDPVQRIPFIATQNGDCPDVFAIPSATRSGSTLTWSMDGLFISNATNSRNINLSIGNHTDVGLYGSLIIRVEEGCISHCRKAHMTTTSLCKDQAGRVWTTGSYGINLLDTDLSVAREFFSKEYCLGMFQTRQGDYWICTTNGVLRVHDLDEQVFTEIHDEPLGMVRKMHMGDSTLYILTHHRTIRTLSVGTDGLSWKPDRAFEIHAPYVHDFLVLKHDGKTEVCFSSEEIVHKLNLSYTQIEIGGGALWQIRKQQQGLLMTGNLGFQVLDYDGGRRSLMINFKRIGMPCTAIAEDKSGTIWIGSINGLYRCRGDSVQMYNPENPLFRERVTDLIILPDETLVISTRGAGLIAIHEGQTYRFDEKQGLASDMCSSLHLGRAGLWVCSNKGLSLIRLAQEGSGFEVDKYTVLDGLPSNMVNDVLEYGRFIFVATERGILVMKGKLKGGNLPDVKIEQVQADGRILPASGELLPDEDNLQIRMQSQKLTPYGNVTYNYILEGYDKDWHSTTDNIVNYYNLPPGRFRFRVTAGYPYAKRNPHEEVLVLYLPYKLYERPGFRLIMLIAGLTGTFFAGWLVYIGRQRRLRSDYTRLQSEVKALRSQMRPHFIFNALNSIQHLILLRDHETANVHLARFAKLMRAVLDASNHESIPISREIEILQMYLELEKLRFGDDFAYTIELQQGVNWEQCRIPPMLLQPLVENAIWHGLRMKRDDPRLWLRFSITEGGRICCEVRDNGIGRKAASQKTQVHKDPSVSLANIEDRIRLINTLAPHSIELSITDLEDDGMATGTLVKLYLTHPPHVTNND